MLSSVVPMWELLGTASDYQEFIKVLLFSFKCDKEVGEIKFDRSDLKGVDKQSLGSLPLVEKFSFATNGIEKLSPGKVTEIKVENVL